MGLETIEIVLWAEKEFNIEIPDSDASKIITLNDFASYIALATSAKHGFKAQSKKAIYEKIKQLLITQYRIPAEFIKHEAKFVTDLGLD